MPLSNNLVKRGLPAASAYFKPLSAMARWFLVVIAVVANIGAVLVALAPGWVTYADVQPAGVACATCTAEAQAAVIRSAAVGRAQIQSLVSSNAWLLIAIALVNIAVVVALVWMLRSNPSVKRGLPTASAYLKR